MNPSTSTFSRLSMALVSFTLATVIYGVYEFIQTKNLIFLAIPALLVLVSAIIISRQRQKRNRTA